jgi:transcriptional regulator with XRE-family HTH domain
MQFGERLKELREQKNLLQRQLAADLEIDTPMFSKIERGERKAKRDQVLKLAEILNDDKDELLTLWLASQVYDIVKNESMAIKALEMTTKYLKQNK